MNPGRIPNGWKRGEPLEIKRIGGHLTIGRTQNTHYDPNAKVHPDEIAFLNFGPREKLPTEWLEWWFA